MMKKIVILALLAFVLFPATSEAVLINYDGTGFQYPTQILDFYSGLDGSPVHSSGLMWLDYFGSVDPTYGPHSISSMAFSLSTNPVDISWGQDVDGVSFWYGYNGFQQTGLSVQGYNDNVLAFDSGLLPLNSNGMFQYTAPDVSIDKLVFNGTPDFWTYDDLSYNVSTTEVPPDNNVIPEPTTLMLLGSGLVGLLRRKLS